MIQLCRRILRNNHQCSQPAVNGALFCRHHRDVKDWKRRSGLRSQITVPTQTYEHGTILVPDPGLVPDAGASRPALSLSKGPDSGTWEAHIPVPVELEFPENPAAILTNIYRVTTLLLHGYVDRPTANSVTYGMQVCLSALNGKPLFEPATPAPAHSRSHAEDADSETTSTDPGCPGPSDVGSRPVHRVILTPDGDEIAPPVELLEDNEAEPVHHKGCPCLTCAEKYRSQPPEQHHPDCQCGLCEEDEGTEPTLSPVPQGALFKPSYVLSENHPNTGTDKGAPSAAQPRVGSNAPDEPALSSEPCALNSETTRRPRIARAAALLAGSSSRDPLNRPWSVAEYTFGDAIRRHEAQYAARAAAALAAGIEPPPYEPFATGLIAPGTPEHEEDQQMQQQSNQYWADHFRKLIADRQHESATAIQWPRNSERSDS